MKLAEIVTKLNDIAYHADRNAAADPSQESARTWQAHARNVREVRDAVILAFDPGRPVPHHGSGPDNL